jgi:hypothetical protein
MDVGSYANKAQENSGQETDEEARKREKKIRLDAQRRRRLREAALTLQQAKEAEDQVKALKAYKQKKMAFVPYLKGNNDGNSEASERQANGGGGGGGNSENGEENVAVFHGHDNNDGLRQFGDDSSRPVHDMANKHHYEQVNEPIASSNTIIRGQIPQSSARRVAGTVIETVEEEEEEETDTDNGSERLDTTDTDSHLPSNATSLEDARYEIRADNIVFYALLSFKKSIFGVGNRVLFL